MHTGRIHGDCFCCPLQLRLQDLLQGQGGPREGTSRLKSLINHSKLFEHTNSQHSIHARIRTLHGDTHRLCVGMMQNHYIKCPAYAQTLCEASFSSPHSWRWYSDRSSLAGDHRRGQAHCHCPAGFCRGCYAAYFHLPSSRIYVLITDRRARGGTGLANDLHVCARKRLQEQRI